MLIDKSQKDSVNTQIALLPEIKAPVSKGQRLGTATIRSGEQILAEIPLVAEEAVQELSFWDIFSLLFKRFTMAKV